MLKMRNKRLPTLSLAIIMAFGAGVVFAGDRPISERPTPPSLIAEMVATAMPPILVPDTTPVVDQMLNVTLAPPLSETFNPGRAIRGLLGRGARSAADCRQPLTKAGDADLGFCIASVGKPDGPGPYRELRYSKHMATGNIEFVNRPPAQDLVFADLKPVTVPDDVAYRSVLDWLLGNIGLAPDEIPQPPVDAIKPFPVKTVMVAEQNLKGVQQSIPIEKLVILQRAIFTGLGGPRGEYDWIPAPGKVVAEVDDTGIQQLAVRGWVELYNPRIDPGVSGIKPKPFDVLVGEITEDLSGMARGPISTVQIFLSYAVTPLPIPSPEASPLPIPLPEGAQLLLPAVQVLISSVPADLDELGQQALSDSQVSTAGSIREYLLVDFINGG